MSKHEWFYSGNEDSEIKIFLINHGPNYIHYVYKFHQCYDHVAMIRVPPNELCVTSSAFPFAACGMENIGQIEQATY